MRKPLALAGCFLLALGSGRAHAQPPGAPPPPAPQPASAAAGGGAGIQFESPEPAAREKELLSHYAQAVARWAMVQRIVKAVQAQEAKPLSMERVQAIDAAWQRGEDPQGLASSLAKNDCAQALQSLVAANPGYGEVFVTDDRGGLVCMSQRTSDYWQGDEEKFSRSYANGAGGVFVSKGERDASTNLFMVHISVPIRAAGHVIGVLVAGRIVSPG